MKSKYLQRFKKRKITDKTTLKYSKKISSDSKSTQLKITSPNPRIRITQTSTRANMKHLKPIYLMTLTLAFACNGKDSPHQTQTPAVKSPEGNPPLTNEPTTVDPDGNVEFCQSLQDQSITIPASEASILVTITSNEEEQTITCDKTKLKD